MDPVLELPAAGLAELLDLFALRHVPDLHHRVAARGEEDLAVRGEQQVGYAVLVAGGKLLAHLARGAVEQRYLAAHAVSLATPADGQRLSVRRVSHRGEHDLVEALAEVGLDLAGRRVPELQARVPARVEDQVDP